MSRKNVRKEYGETTYKAHFHQLKIITENVGLKIRSPKKGENSMGHGRRYSRPTNCGVVSMLALM